MCKDNMIELKSKQVPDTPELFADKLKEIYNDIK